jgi:hypothetical protein
MKYLRILLLRIKKLQKFVPYEGSDETWQGSDSGGTYEDSITKYRK